MKRAGILLIILTALSGILSGCSPAKESSTKSDKVKVYTSFYPMYDFAYKIGGDKAEIINLVPAGTEPHDWEPSPSDIVSLENSDIFIYSGLGMEQWADKVLETLSNKNLVIVKASDGVSLIESDAHKGETDVTSDPHVWLSIRNAVKQMENIKNAFVKADSINEQFYQDNFNKYKSELDKLDKEFTDTLSKLPNKEVVVSHDAFAYLCRDYGLKQVPIDGLSPDSEPNPAKMAEIINFVKEHNVKVIFFEELVSPKIAETIARATGAQTDELNPLEGLSDEAMAGGSDYISVMRENLAALKTALE